MKRSETKVAEEYCWVITHAVGRLCYCRSRSSMLEFEFQLDSRITRPTFIVERMCSHFRLKYCIEKLSTNLVKRVYIKEKGGHFPNLL
jgi:hypothetical protein